MSNKYTTGTDDINPSCAANFATLTEQMRQNTEALTKVAEIINGTLEHPGLTRQTENNTRDIAEVAKVLKEMNDARKIETEEREKESAERRADTRKWWLGLGTALVTSLLSVAQTIAIAITLARIAGK